MLIKGIWRVLEHSGKCGGASDRVAVECGMRADFFPANQQSLFLRRSVEHI
ncbi:unnamed protein product [Hymenolepis diminuta]|uniref:Uncharacterized protein n=1 Tax=Hymenolepis diminuta TaxID=6216 RepID=A0A564YVL1_HYMDI|nr:unnamed protein product [Hymenolepis diminuta]